MKKLLKWLVVMGMGALVLTGCSKEKEKEEKTADYEVKLSKEQIEKLLADNKYIKKIPSEMKDDEYVVYGYTYDYDVKATKNEEVSSEDTQCFSTTISILSKSKLDEKDVKVSLDNEKIPYNVSCNYLQVEELSEEDGMTMVAMIYNDIDKSISDDEKKYNEMIDEVKELGEGLIPDFYENQITLEFMDSKLADLKESFHKVTLNIKGKDYTVDIGEVRFNMGDFVMIASDKDNSSDDTNVMDYHGTIINDEEKDKIIFECYINALMDFTFSNVTLLNQKDKAAIESITIEKCSVITETNEDGSAISDYETNGDSYTLAEGEFYDMKKDNTYKLTVELNSIKDIDIANFYFDIEYIIDEMAEKTQSTSNLLANRAEMSFLNMSEYMMNIDEIEEEKINKYSNY